MDKWLTLIQAANRLNIHEHDLFDATLKGKINLTWKPNFPIRLYEVDASASEPQWIDYSNWDGSPIDSLRAGFFKLDLTLCPDWREPLFNIKTGGLGYGFDYFDSIDPLVVMEVGPDGYIWSVTPPPELDTGKELNFPTIQTLGVFEKELDRYINQLKQVESRPKNFKYKQANTSIQRAIAAIDLTTITSEKGKSGLKDSVWVAVKDTKDVNGCYLFSTKGKGEPKKNNFTYYWKNYK